MKIVRSNRIEIYPCNSFEYSVIKQLIEKECTRDNPKYIKAMKSNRFQKGLTRKIVTFKEIKDKFLIHKANYQVYEKLLNSNLKIEEIQDLRISNKIEVNATAGPRDNEQKKAISTLYDWYINGFGYGCLNAAPAAGKTFMAINLFTKLKEKTLVIVDMKLLIEQFIESILRFSDTKENEIGYISESKADYKNKKIIIATAQTLIKKASIIEELENEIGFLIVDEVHVASANTFQQILPRFKPKYQLGLSGSHDRDDKMDFLVKEAVGPIVSTIEREDLIKAGSIMTPILRPVFLMDNEKFDKYNRGNIDFRDVVDNYFNCPKVINKVSKMVLHYYKQERSQLLICKEKSMVDAYYLSIVSKLVGENFIRECEEFIKQKLELLEKEILDIESRNLESFSTKKDLKDLENKKISKKEFIKKYQTKKEKVLDDVKKKVYTYLNKKWYETEIAKNNELFKSVEILTGSISSKERNRIIDETNKGKIKVLISTSVMDKAVSINRLDTLYLLFSTRERANTTQRVGRISRTFKGKTDAVVFDFIYDHYMSFFQFHNNSGDCRMYVHQNFTKVHESNSLFIKWLNARYRDNFRLTKEEEELFKQYYKRYVIDVT